MNDPQLQLFDDLDGWIDEFVRQGMADIEALLSKHAAFHAAFPEAEEE